MPDPAEVNVTDPRLLAWLHEPQLLQRDEKEIEGYTLEVSPYPNTPLTNPFHAPSPILLRQHTQAVLYSSASHKITTQRRTMATLRVAVAKRLIIRHCASIAHLKKPRL